MGTSAVGLKAVPDDLVLACYRCKTRGVDSVASMYKTLKTPNGSTYPRGWCRKCLREKGIYLDDTEDDEEQMVVARGTGDPRRPIRPGSTVTVTITGEVSHYLGGVDNGNGYPPDRVVLHTDKYRGVVVPVGAIRSEEDAK